MSLNRVSVASLISLVITSAALVGCGADAEGYYESQHAGGAGGQAGAAPVSQAGAATNGGQGGMAAAPVKVHDCIVALSVVNSASWNFPAELYGYKLLAQDLNAGSGGDFIAVYYKLGPDDGSQGTCISRIYAINTSHGESNIPGGTRIDVDLNYSVGGDFIYLGFIQDASQPPIRSVAIYNQTYNKFTFSERGGNQFQYTWVSKQNSTNWQDLNEGAGGDLIFVGYTTDFTAS
jgi:hypothetical protein